MSCVVRGSLLLALGLSLAVADFQDAAVEDNQVATGDLPGRQPKFGLATSLLTNFAQDLLTRSTTSSQVLSLNLTNLVILLVLKAIIFGASSFGLGQHGRSIDPTVQEPQKDPFVTQSELLMAMSYLKGDMNQRYGCLHRIACEDPKKAKEYLFAANMILKGASLFSKSAAESRYNKVLSDLDEAAQYGVNAQDCSIRYSCERGR